MAKNKDMNFGIENSFNFQAVVHEQLNSVVAVKILLYA